MTRTIHYNLVNHAAAEPFYLRPLAIGEKTLGPDEGSRNGVEQSGRPVPRGRALCRSESFLKRSIAIGEKTLGPDNPSIVMALGNLGAAYSNQRR